MRIRLAAFLLLVAVFGVAGFYFLRPSHVGNLVTIDRPLPGIGDSIYLAYEEYTPPLQVLDGGPKNKADYKDWMRPDEMQFASTLTFDEFAALCTPGFLSETEMTRARYEEGIQLAKANRQKFGPVSREIMYFLSARVNRTEFGAVCSVIQGLRTYRFFKKSGAQWKYDAFNHQANPFSVLPYSDLEAIKEMVATGKARVDEKGELRPIENVVNLK